MAWKWRKNNSEGVECIIAVLIEFNIMFGQKPLQVVNKRLRTAALFPSASIRVVCKTQPIQITLRFPF